MMKKILLATLCALLLLAAAACGGTEKDAVVGEWKFADSYITAFSQMLELAEDDDLNAEQSIKEMEAVVYTFRDDGTFTASSGTGGEDANGTYLVDNGVVTVTVDGASQELTLDGDFLLFDGEPFMQRK